MVDIMQKIHDQVKDNARELKYLKDQCGVIDRRADKNDQCHSDMKARMGKMDLKLNTVQLEVTPIKRIMWIVLTLLITSVGGAVLALVIIK